MKSNKNFRIILYDPSGSGGICHYTFQLAESLVQLGNSVTVATLQGYELSNLKRQFKLNIVAKQSWIKSFIVRFTNTRSRSNGRDPLQTDILQGEAALTGPLSVKGKLASVFRILKTVRLLLMDFKIALMFLLRRPHLVHFQLVNRDEDYFFIKLLHWLRFRTVYTAHDLLPHDSDTADDRRTFGDIYKRVDGIIVHSESDKKEMVSIFNIAPSKISVVPHGGNDLFYRNHNLSKEQARVFLDIPQNKKVILFFGHIKRYKGLEYLVEAFLAIRQRVNNSFLLIAGKIDDPYYSNLLAGLSDKGDIRCINQYIPFHRVAYYFTASDVVVLPYVKTYQSGVLLSAYAAGRPVVVTDTGGLSEIVQRDKSGLVVPPRNVHALAEAITEIINSPDKTEELGMRAKALAGTTYSWETAALMTVDVYHSLLNNSNVTVTGRLIKRLRSKNNPYPCEQPNQPAGLKGEKRTMS